MLTGSDFNLDLAFMKKQTEHNDFAGMTVNERIFAAGLMDLFDNAIAENNKEEVILILKKVNLNSEIIEANLKSIFKD